MVRVADALRTARFGDTDAPLADPYVIAWVVVLSAAKDLHPHCATARAGPSPVAQDDTARCYAETRIAVKVIDARGNELMVAKTIGEAVVG